MWFSPSLPLQSSKLIDPRKDSLEDREMGCWVREALERGGPVLELVLGQAAVVLGSRQRKSLRTD